MFCDIRRICEQPTEEDRYWFPDIAGSDWLKTLHFAMENFKDESFISQYLSPTIIRKFKLFGVLDDESKNYLSVSAIHDEQGYREIRQILSSQYNLSNNEPNIQVHNVMVNGDRSLTLRYIPARASLWQTVAGKYSNTCTVFGALMSLWSRKKMMAR